MEAPGHTLIRQQRNEQESWRLKDERARLRFAAPPPPPPHHHTLNSGPHMTNAWPVIIQQQVCRRWEPGEGKE